MPRPKHRIDILNAGYRLDGTDKEWLQRLLHAMHGVSLVGPLDRRAAAFMFQVSPAGHSFKPRDYVVHNAPEQLTRFIRYRHSALSPAEVAVRFCGRPVLCATLSQRKLPNSQPGPQMGVADYLGLQVTDSTGIGCCLVFETSRRGRVRADQLPHWEGVAHHLRTGLRLRTKLAGRDIWQFADAVVDVDAPGGRVVHARSRARSRDARAALRRHAVAIDRARSQRHGTDDTDAIDHWSWLVNGHWTLVEQFDSDGRRFYIAIRNRPEASHVVRLSELERKVAEMVALGWSDKDIAHRTDLSSKYAVNACLQYALAKLRVRSRIELAVLAGDLAITPMSLGDDQLLLMRLSPEAIQRFDEWQLTTAERDVVLRIMRGFSNKHIAEQRGNSTSTITNQVQSVFAKLDVTSRTEMAAMLV